MEVKRVERKWKRKLSCLVDGENGILDCGWIWYGYVPDLGLGRSSMSITLPCLVIH